MASPQSLKKPEFKQKLLRRKSVILLFLAAVVGLAVYATITVLSAPAQGTTIHSGSTAAAAKQSIAVIPKQEATPDNQYFSLTLPAGYHVQENSVITTASTLYTLNLTKPGAMGTLLVAISIKPLPPGGITEDTSYAMRSSQPEKYMLSTATIAGRPAPISSDRQSGAVTAFFSSDRYLATVSMSSGLGNPGTEEQRQIIAALTGLLALWQWRA
ncbi:MAG: hypothetical protein JWM81_1125 [Candidatus Saccharibacteria bacterium]|nr:hypothetical protein [Candidatus Saccharibacteria bacterium]